jgi:alanyl-tRNA synthetase
MNNYKNIRLTFINFFKEKQHKVLSPSSLLPKNDTSIFFTNAGMNQFKKYFTLEETSPIKRAVTIQPCVRAGGKHNDLDNVGFTSRHHTFFEMMGNFSFEDYGKKEAILYALELLIKHYNLPEDKLFFTVHENDKESFDFLKTVTKQPILSLNTDDNFWSMGDTGPCGYSCEIYYYTGGENPTIDDFKKSFEDLNPEFLEIWNLVFMEFNKTPTEIIKLDKISIDTGMGLERLLSVIEGTNNNYTTSLMNFFVNGVKETLNITDNNVAYVAADHIRTSVFLLDENLKIGNEGASYVLRKIIRRALTYLNLKEPGFYKLAKYVKDFYKEYYTIKDISYIEETIRQEEILFLNTIHNGFDKLTGFYESNNIDENVVFKLYETYGLPLDFSFNFLQTKGIKLDFNIIDNLMENHKKVSGKTINYNFDLTTIEKYYEEKEIKSKVLMIFKDGIQVNNINNINEEFLLITEASCFYPRGGGQEGDVGEIFNNNSKIEVINTTKKNKTIIHHCKLIEGEININEEVTLKINEEWRKGTSIHHTSTHILHAILQELFGEDLEQKGSFITKDKFRFDFNFNRSLTLDEKKLIEEKFNNIINKGIDINIEYKSLKEAEEAGRLTGVEYEDIVRIINIPNVSYVLCGGTHLTNTKTIKNFKIISEKSIGSGIRRIEVKCDFSSDH